LQDVKEVEAILESLDAASYHPKMIPLWILNAVEGKDPARESLAKLIPALAQSDKKLITREQIEGG
jgi:SLT domain-containing protein